MYKAPGIYITFGRGESVGPQPVIAASVAGGGQGYPAGASANNNGGGATATTAGSAIGQPGFGRCSAGPAENGK